MVKSASVGMQRISDLNLFKRDVVRFRRKHTATILHFGGDDVTYLLEVVCGEFFKKIFVLCNIM